MSKHGSAEAGRLSCTGLTRVAGELVAIPFKTSKEPAYTPQPASAYVTTNQHFIRQARAAADSADVRCKQLMPYRCWAPRNRPKDTLTNAVGKRTEQGKAVSSVAIADADPESRKPWKTTNQVFQACALVRDTVGLANSGIASDVAARLHKTQGIYKSAR